MSLVKPVSGDTWHFWCVGCKCVHGFNRTWKFNGNFKAPTVTPSLLTQWNDTEGEHKCHLFIENGSLQYLPDSTHELAGQTVPMVEVDN